MSIANDSAGLDEATAAIQAELDGLAQRTAGMSSTSADAVAREAVQTIARCVALRNRLVSVDALVRTTALERRATQILDRCRAVRGQKK